MLLNRGDQFPAGVEFQHVPLDLDNVDVMNPLTCDRPIPLKMDNLISELGDKNFVIVAAPGSFTPACTENHIPGFLSNLEKLKQDKNIGAVIIITFNDPFVVSAWGKLLVQAAGLKKGKDYPKIYFASDMDGKFSGAHNMKKDNGRLERYALVVNAKTRKVSYLGLETRMGVSVSGADEVLKAKL